MLLFFAPHTCIVVHVRGRGASIPDRDEAAVLLHGRDEANAVVGVPLLDDWHHLGAVCDAVSAVHMHMRLVSAVQRQGGSNHEKER